MRKSGCADVGRPRTRKSYAARPHPDEVSGRGRAASGPPVPGSAALGGVQLTVTASPASVTGAYFAVK